MNKISNLPRSIIMRTDREDITGINSRPRSSSNILIVCNATYDLLTDCGVITHKKCMKRFAALGVVDEESTTSIVAVKSISHDENVGVLSVEKSETSAGESPASELLDVSIKILR